MNFLKGMFGGKKKNTKKDDGNKRTNQAAERGRDASDREAPELPWDEQGVSDQNSDRDEGIPSENMNSGKSLRSKIETESTPYEWKNKEGQYLKSINTLGTKNANSSKKFSEIYQKSLKGCESCKNYKFQVELYEKGKDYSLVDSLLFLLCNTESILVLAEDDDILNNAKSTDNLGALSSFFEMVRKVNSEGNAGNMDDMKKYLTSAEGPSGIEEVFALIASGMRQTLFKMMEVEPAEVDTSIADLIEMIVSDYRENGLSVSDNNVSASLVWRLYRDLLSIGHMEVEGEDKVEALYNNIEVLKKAVTRSPQISCFVQHLARLSINDTVFDSLDMDETGERVVGVYRTILFRDLKQTGQSEYLRVVSQQQPLKYSSFNRYDLTQNHSIGTLTLKMNFLTSITCRSMVFFLPSGKKYEIEHQRVLSNVEIPGITDNSEYDQYFLRRPSVLDSVAKLESREKFAISDYDWVQLNFNAYQNFLTWVHGSEEMFRFIEGQINPNLLFSYSIKFKDLVSSIKIPIFSKTHSNLPEFKNSFMDLYITENKDSTMQDLVNFLVERSNIQGLDSTDIKWNALSFVRLDTKLEVKAQSKNDKLVDLVKRVNQKVPIETGIYKNRTIHFFCKLTGKSVNDSAINKNEEKKTNETLEEVIKLTSTETIKVEPTNFLDYLLKVSFKKMKVMDNQMYFFRNQLATFYLPKILLLSVEKIAPHVIDPKKNLSFDMFRSLLEEMKMYMSAEYMLKGVICDTAKDPNLYYPIKVDPFLQTCTGYLGKQMEFSLKDLNDAHVKYILFERKEADFSK